jgi:hypothetical protein
MGMAVRKEIFRIVPRRDSCEPKQMALAPALSSINDGSGLPGRLLVEFLLC